MSTVWFISEMQEVDFCSTFQLKKSKLLTRRSYKDVGLNWEAELRETKYEQIPPTLFNKNKLVPVW